MSKRAGASIILGMNLGFPEMVFLGLLALLLFGPRRLPEIGRQIGKALAEFKRTSNEFQSQLEDEVRHLETESHSILPPQEPHGGRRDAGATTPPDGAVAQTAAETPPAPVPAGGDGAKGA